MLQLPPQIFARSNLLHFKKYCNFTWFPGVEMLRKGTVSAFMLFRKVFTPGNQLKSRYFSQCYKWKQKVERYGIVKNCELLETPKCLSTFLTLLTFWTIFIYIVYLYCTFFCPSLWQGPFRRTIFPIPKYSPSGL